MKWNNGVCKFCGESESSGESLKGSEGDWRRITYFCGTEVRVFSTHEVYCSGTLCELNLLKKKHANLEQRVLSVERMIVSKNMSL